MMDAADVNSADSWPDDVGDAVEGYLANWFIRRGSVADAGGTLCEIQVEKMSVGATVPTTGTATEIAVAEDGDFTRGDVFARVQPSV